jgi:hypothetical protein
VRGQKERAEKLGCDRRAEAQNRLVRWQRINERRRSLFWRSLVKNSALSESFARGAIHLRPEKYPGKESQ